MIWQAKSNRNGFTLIELIAVMIAATVLLVSLASTVLLSTRLLESPPEDSQQWHDREIADRLAADLRYATDVNEASGYGYAITKPNAVTGTSETASYEAYYKGLTRQIDSGPVINLDVEAPSHQFLVDGVTAPTYVVSPNVPRVRSSSSAGTAGTSRSLQIDLPSGCKDGDLLLLVVAARTPWFLITPSDWNYLDFLSRSSLRMRVMYKTYNSASAGIVNISAFPSAGMSAAIVAIENVDPSNPILWHGSSSGYASAYNSDTHPTPLEPTSFYPNQLNVQILAAEGDPWYDGGLGLPAFTDVVQDTGGDGWWVENSVTVAARSGPLPDLTTTPRFLHLSSGDWAQVAVQVGVAP